MKQIFLIFACVLLLFALHTHLAQARIIENLENWSDYRTDASTFLYVSGSTTAYVYYFSGTHLIPPYWAVTGNSYAYANADSLGDNTWYNATAWCEGSGNENTSPTPGRDNINQKRTQWDSEGRPYYGDSYTDGDAEIAYRAHPVGTKYNPWTGSRKTRTLSLSVYCSYHKRNDQTPTGLTAEPEMSASIDGSSRRYVNLGIGSASISDPD